MTTTRGESLPSDPRLNRRLVLRYGLGAGMAAVLGGALVTRGLPASGKQPNPATPVASPGACVASPAASPAVASPVAAVTIRMTNQLRFDPDHVTIATGQTVTWVNASAIPHTTTDDPAKNPVASTFPQYAQLPPGAAPWDSGLLQPGQSFSHTFTVPGTYHYFCIPHIVSGMRATIVVRC